MFVTDWRQAWRWWSVRVSALGAILAAIALCLPDLIGTVWDQLPASLLARLPRNVAMVVPILLNLAAIGARVLQQRQPGPSDRRGLLASKSGKMRPGTGIGAAAVAYIAAVLALEGGYVNHAADPGGETNMGITKAVAVQNGYAGPMRALPRDVAHSIYYRRYLVAPGYAPLVDIDAAVTEELFDTTVNMGPARPSRWFQAAIGAQCGVTVKVDGRIGAGTIAAYRACQGRIGAAKLCLGTLDVLDANQLAEYRRLVRINPRLQVFLRGWTAKRIGNVDRAKCRAVKA